ncbi:C40 family peptidase [Nonomuraea sp. NN258]|uniref:C40 family peptidase n=1 Tax=Nonomuraea antri TaxID=2730852 RepID=UPI0015683B14|nr:C40 family peptidase [Nonomuraea antri]NRQ30651.1 C40 family peptidase [Nonomuraea antri]
MPVVAATASGALMLVAVIICVMAAVLPGHGAPAPANACGTACAPLLVNGTGGSAAITAALRWLGTPYSYGGGGIDGPTRGIGQGANTVGFDCSGLTRYAWHRAGIAIPRTSGEQWQALTHVPPDRRAPGDLVFFQGADGSANYPGHVGLVLDTERMIEAPRTGLRVRVSRYTTRRGIIGYARPGRS